MGFTVQKSQYRGRYKGKGDAGTRTGADEGIWVIERNAIQESTKVKG